jgi:site-specific DNA recombinase
MQASWNHGNAYYRCKFPAEYAVTTEQHFKTIYVRESSIVPSLDSWIATLFEDEHVDGTCDSVGQMSDLVPDDHERQAKVRAQITDCDLKLAKYRALLERDGDLDVVGAWIAEITRERSRLERDIGRKPTGHQFTAVEIKAMVRQLKNIVDILNNADPETQRAVYDELGVKLTYFPDGRVHVGAAAPLVSPGKPSHGSEGPRVLVVSVGGPGD